MELKITSFIRNNSNWLELLTQAPYNLIINEDDDYYLLKYNQLDSDFTEDIVKECRGLIIGKDTLEPKALSFTKFFNVQEPNADRIDWKSAKVQEKIDGSKILVWYDYGWHVSTSGQLDAFKVNVSNFPFTFGDLFVEALKNNNLHFDKYDGIYALQSYDDNTNESYTMPLLNCDYCYTFELVSPKSRVVIPYKQTDLYYIGKRNILTFDEEELDSETDDLNCIKIKKPKSYKLDSLQACLNATQKMGFDEEGFVVVDKYWRRVKIKSPQYVLVHHTRNNNVQSMSRLLEVAEKNEIDEFLAYCPEWEDEIKEIDLKLAKYKNELRYALLNIEHVKQDKNRKEIAEYIKNYYNEFSGFLFKFLDVDLIDMFIEVEWKKLTSDQKLKRLGIKDNGQGKDE